MAGGEACVVLYSIVCNDSCKDGSIKLRAEFSLGGRDDLQPLQVTVSDKERTCNDSYSPISVVDESEFLVAPSVDIDDCVDLSSDMGKARVLPRVPIEICHHAGSIGRLGLLTSSRAFIASVPGIHSTSMLSVFQRHIGLS